MQCSGRVIAKGCVWAGCCCCYAGCFAVQRYSQSCRVPYTHIAVAVSVQRGVEAQQCERATAEQHNQQSQQHAEQQQQ